MPGRLSNEIFIKRAYIDLAELFYIIICLKDFEKIAVKNKVVFIDAKVVVLLPVTLETKTASVVFIIEIFRKSFTTANASWRM